MLSRLIQWTPEQRAQWEKTRLKGKNHFAWTRGVGCWGVAMFVFSMARQIPAWASGGPAISWGNLLFHAILWSGGGYFWGIWFWAIMEKSYLKDIEKSG